MILFNINLQCLFYNNFLLKKNFSQNKGFKLNEGGNLINKVIKSSLIKHCKEMFYFVLFFWLKKNNLIAFDEY